MRFVAKAVRMSAARGLLAGASLAALALAAPPALAEEAAADSGAAEPSPPDPAPNASAAGKQIVVTGSRVVTNGMDSPVPVTAVPAEQLDAMDPSSLIASAERWSPGYSESALSRVLRTAAS